MDNGEGQMTAATDTITNSTRLMYDIVRRHVRLIVATDDVAGQIAAAIVAEVVDAKAMEILVRRLTYDVYDDDDMMMRVVDGYLSNLHVTMWGQFFRLRSEEDRRDAAGWMVKQLKGVEGYVEKMYDNNKSGEVGEE